MATFHPDLLISDIAMPDQDGHDLIRQIRAGGRNAKDLPAIALTAFAHKEDRRCCARFPGSRSTWPSPPIRTNL